MAVRLSIPRFACLPRTGQTAAQSLRPGDDGDLLTGHPLAGRFVDNADGTIMDLIWRPALQWVKQPELIIPGATGVHATNQIQRARSTWKVPPDDGLGDYLLADLVQGDGVPDSLFYVCILQHAAAADKEPPNVTYWRPTVWTASAANLTTPATHTRNNAVDRCLGSDLGGSGLSYAGRNDWRLPNAVEAFSLFDVSVLAAPWVSPTFFPNTQSGYYWTGTRATSSANGVVIGHSGTGLVVTPAGGTGTYYARPVRGGVING
jgi:hypothetical protein